MHLETHPDWDPAAPAVLADQYSAYDRMRAACPVAYSPFQGWTVFRHADVVRVVHDHKTFSNVVSRHLSVPNGMDLPEHREYRHLVERFFHSERLSAYAPECRTIAHELAASLPKNRPFDLVSTFARPLAARAQCSFLGWPRSMEGVLQDWTVRNQTATFHQDRQALTALAEELRGHIVGLLREWRGAETARSRSATDELLQAQVWGRHLTDDELVSILRNWTVGEIGTLASAIGIIVRFLANNPEWQHHLRASPRDRPAAIEEMLRLYGPLLSNRRRTTRAVQLGGRWIGAGERVTIAWIAANRDPEAFDDPLAFRLERDQTNNLLYGAGLHVCPGAPLARLELRAALDAVFASSTWIDPVPNDPAIQAGCPASGFAKIPILIQ